MWEEKTKEGIIQGSERVGEVDIAWLNEKDKENLAYEAPECRGCLPTTGCH